MLTPFFICVFFCTHKDDSLIFVYHNWEFRSDHVESYQENQKDTTISSVTFPLITFLKQQPRSGKPPKSMFSQISRTKKDSLKACRLIVLVFGRGILYNLISVSPPSLHRYLSDFCEPQNSILPSFFLWFHPTSFTHFNMIASPSWKTFKFQPTPDADEDLLHRPASLWNLFKHAPPEMISQSIAQNNCF